MTRFKSCAALIVVVALLVAILPAFAEEAKKINLNTATQEELESLKQIGPGYAAKIIEYRETVGPFKTPEQIMEVKGIGEKAYELNKDVIVVE